MVNFRAVKNVKNALKLHENDMQNYVSIGYKLIKIAVYIVQQQRSQSCDKRIIKRTEDVI